MNSFGKIGSAPSNTMRPSIDVIIPLYNGAAFIATAIESVIAQTYSPTHIIIINDGSTDKGPEIATSYQTKTSIPLVIINQENKGLSAARNTGINTATSEYIAFLDADDVWIPEKLQKQIGVFNKSDISNLGLVYCLYNIINAQGQIDPHGFVVPLDTSIRGAVFSKLLKGNKILSSGSGVLIKRTVFETVGQFNETLRFGEDWDMWLRIAEQYGVDYSDTVLVHIRRHGQNMTTSKKRVFQGEIAFYRVWLRYMINHNRRVPLRWKLKIIYKILTLFPPVSLIKQALPVLFVPRNTFGK